jgi:membrane-associated phospholipid phosphatase
MGKMATRILSCLAAAFATLTSASFGLAAEPAVTKVEGGSVGAPSSTPSGPHPLPRASLLDNFWPSDLDSCLHNDDALCIRVGWGHFIEGAGLASLGAGLAMNIVDSALDNPNDRCKSVAFDELCTPETTVHGLYGDVPTDKYTRDGASTSRGISDGFFYGNVAAGGVLSLLWGRRYAVTFAASLGYTMLTTELLKVAVGNPRPIAWADSSALEQTAPEDRYDLVDEQLSSDAYHSFPSGHTSMTAAATSSIVTMLEYHFLEIAKKNGDYGPAIGWGIAGPLLSLGMTTTVGALRVAGGAHHAADVLVGGSIGTMFGILVPILMLEPATDQKERKRHGGLELESVSVGVANGQGTVQGLW